MFEQAEETQLPPAILALARNYPAHLCQDSSAKHTSQKMKTMCEKIATLNTQHRRYEVDGGLDMLWHDIAQVAKNAYQEGDSILGAVEHFLDVSLQEIPHTSGDLQ